MNELVSGVSGRIFVSVRIVPVFRFDLCEMFFAFPLSPRIHGGTEDHWFRLQTNDGHRNATVHQHVCRFTLSSEVSTRRGFFSRRIFPAVAKTLEGRQWKEG
jgi:hypothetical protein